MLLLSSVNADVFNKGNVAVGLLVGGGSIASDQGDKQYSLVGANVDYFVIDNLSLGLGYTQWFGNDPSISQVTIPLNYYYPLNEKWHPYVGTFYRHTSIGKPYENFNSYGLKAGVAAQISKRAFLGGGWIQEYYDNCSNFHECSSGYPELLLIFTF